MKLVSLIPFLFFTLCAAAQTQTVTATQQEKEHPGRDSREAKHRVVLGIKAGINRSNVYDSQGQDFVADGKTGFAGGAFLALPIGGLFGFQPEVLISQKGFHGHGTLLGQPYSVDRTTTYLDVPLQIQIKPFRFLSVLAGVNYAYLLGQNDSFTYGPNRLEQQQEFKNDNIRKNILGVIGGVDVNLRHIVLSGRMGWDAIANHGDGTSDTPRYKNLWLQITLGYRFY